MECLFSNEIILKIEIEESPCKVWGSERCNSPYCNYCKSLENAFIIYDEYWDNL